MVFSSLEFLLCFLPLFFIIYTLFPQRMKNFVLFLFSLIFYAYGVLERPIYVVLMFISVIVNYLLGLMMGKTKNKKWSKVCLGFGIFYNFGQLFVFKYLDFILGNINGVLDFLRLEVDLPLTHLVLPIGISFYTFQITSYLVDVYKEKIEPERSFLGLGTFLCMFPQLIAGPIVTYEEVAEGLENRVYQLKGIEEGLRVFTLGLGAKVLIANRMGGLWAQAAAIGYESISTPLAWMAIIAYSLQIYFDFFGYSLMAIGLGKMLGFQFPKNFDCPYLSSSMTEFWRRWHMTLGRWFREYVYIPLGGNRKHPIRNLWIVWILTGIWHGAGWNFVLWGLWNGFLIMIEKMGLYHFWKKHSRLGRCYVWLMIPLSWSMFAITNLERWTIFVKKLFPFLGTVEGMVFQGDYIKYFKQYGWIMVIALLFCTRLPGNVYKRSRNKLLVTLFLVLIFWACIYTMYLGLDDPFLYYQF